MAAFKDRKTFLENLTFMALMAAVVIIASVFAAFVPLGAIIVMIALPLPSAVIAFYCRPRYYVIYLFGTIGIAIAATAWNFSSTLFYTIPAVLTGLLYGFLKRRGASTAETVFVTALLNLGLSYLSIAGSFSFLNRRMPRRSSWPRSSPIRWCRLRSAISSSLCRPSHWRTKKRRAKPISSIRFMD